MANINYPEKFTTNNIIAYAAEKHEISKKDMKDIYETIFDVISAGVLQGERVPVGNFGKAYVKIRPASKERQGRNPLTGEEITIKAKPATKVPKFTFGKSYKEACLNAKLKK